ncbi:hypothetical protein ACFQHO_53880 [Actinomadura yumaensis]|uniref:hypothetical protein n=1 Tax=Actinomadura yumaensis TaxID=111807 RepID=UPI0036086AE8
MTLGLIRTRPDHRGRGLADAALHDVTALADRLGLTLRLRVEPITGDEDTCHARLIAWYSRHQFVPVAPSAGAERVTMQREPQE